jgi:hypothetical protein
MMDLASQQVQKETLSACAPLATSAGTGLVLPMIRDIFDFRRGLHLLTGADGCKARFSGKDFFLKSYLGIILLSLMPMSGLRNPP